MVSRLAWISLLLCTWTLGCVSENPEFAATQVMLRIHIPDVQLIGKSSALRVTLFRREAAGNWVHRSTLQLRKEALQWPVDIPITPSSEDAASKPFEVVVEVLRDGAVQAESRAVATFVPRDWRMLELWLLQCPQDGGGFVCAAPDCHGANCKVCSAPGHCTATGEHGEAQLLTFDPDLKPASKPAPTGSFTMDGDGVPPPDATGAADTEVPTSEPPEESTAAATDAGMVSRHGPDPTEASIAREGAYNVQTYAGGFGDGPSPTLADIHFPADATPPLAIVAIVPGVDQTRETMTSWGTFLASHGLVTVVIDSYATSDRPEARAAALLDALQATIGENEREGSPLQGMLATDRRGVMGYSTGGGGALLAAGRDASLSAAVSLSGWAPGSYLGDVHVPSMVVGGNVDPINTQPQALYAALPADTPRMLYEVQEGDGTETLTPGGVDGAVGGRALAWLKFHLEGDDRYWPLLMQQPPQAASWRLEPVES